MTLHFLFNPFAVQGAFLTLLVGLQNTVRNRLLKGRKNRPFTQVQLRHIPSFKQIINSTISNQVSIQKVR